MLPPQFPSLIFEHAGGRVVQGFDAGILLGDDQPVEHIVNDGADLGFGLLAFGDGHVDPV